MNDVGVSGELIALAREAKGWKQRDLAERVDVSQGFVSKVERGQLALDEVKLTEFADALDVPAALLLGDHDLPGLALTCLHHRRRASRIPAVSAKRIEGLTQLVGLSVRRLSAGTAAPTMLSLQRHPVDSGSTPSEAAMKLRADWGVPPGPVDNVVDLLERAGIAVVPRHLGTDAQDAVSMWPPGTDPLVLLNTGLPPDRARFTLVHELGHLVLHEFPDDGQEEQANEFAAAFLMPAEDIRPELDGLTVRQFPRLAKLKARWKVSMGALIQRAHQLAVISPSQYKSFRIRLNQYGWSKREPGDIPAEVPRLLRSRIEHHLDLGRTAQQLADLALMRPEPFARHYLTTSAQPPPAATGTSEVP
ncbi:XRE family transcriptional regulator [Saccharothrix sp. NPDC042600]|uniref:XRE family transcriptional regulator n=1 Tax=Saccharothrix TaxID=2071 RepID=UPI0034051900|nr:ImmA/IrrE family metallo-endopeptidase [Saccharothrix mutabilis subsp. capreolus]